MSQARVILQSGSFISRIRTELAVGNAIVAIKVVLACSKGTGIACGNYYKKTRYCYIIYMYANAQFHVALFFNRLCEFFPVFTREQTRVFFEYFSESRMIIISHRIKDLLGGFIPEFQHPADFFHFYPLNIFLW